MATDLEKITAVQELLEKNAFVGALVGAAGRGAFRAGKGLGGWVVRNPGKAFGGAGLSLAFGAMDVKNSMQQASQQVANSREWAKTLSAPQTF